MPAIRTATFSEVLADLGGASEPGGLARPLPQLVAGSWVYGNLSTWIGSPSRRTGRGICWRRPSSATTW